MAETNLTITELEDTFSTITSQILGTLDESRVRIGWPREGAPAWKIDEDIAFILVAFDDDPYTRQTETTYPALDQFNANQSVAYTRVVRVSWTFYGPSSFEDADKVRVEFLRQNFKDTLKAKNLFLITDTPCRPGCRSFLTAVGGTGHRFICDSMKRLIAA
ncbi:hypothetical protein LJK88_38255 [Paenibacillus sp. P26]|nr:hypothetical protein LJK88_38255 [Paenibacillus sp. P26]UUZ93246.1 hypothetical protein LJK87_00030 [Paenibacillus sp. P25]